MLNSIKKTSLALVFGILIAAMPMRTECSVGTTQSINQSSKLFRFLKYPAYFAFILFTYGSHKDVSDATFGIVPADWVLWARKKACLEVKPKLKTSASFTIPTERELSDEETGQYARNGAINAKNIFKKLEETQEIKAEKAFDPVGPINKTLKTFAGEFGVDTMKIATQLVFWKFFFEDVKDATEKLFGVPIDVLVYLGLEKKL